MGNFFDASGTLCCFSWAEDVGASNTIAVSESGDIHGSSSASNARTLCVASFGDSTGAPVTNAASSGSGNGTIQRNRPASVMQHLLAMQEEEMEIGAKAAKRSHKLQKPLLRLQEESNDIQCT